MSWCKIGEFLKTIQGTASYVPSMVLMIVKYLVTAGIIVGVSEIAKRTDRMGALIASLPLVTIMVMAWLWFEGQGSEKIANHAWYTFWYVIPTMPMFLLLPWMLHKGIGFWWSLLAGIALTFACFVVTALIAKRVGVELIP